MSFECFWWFNCKVLELQGPGLTVHTDWERAKHKAILWRNVEWVEASGGDKYKIPKRFPKQMMEFHMLWTEEESFLQPSEG